MTDSIDAIRRQMTLGQWSLLAALAILWGGSFFFVGVAVTALPPLTIVLSRVGLAALVLWLVIALSRRPVPRHPRVWTSFLIMGAVNNVIPFSLIAFGQTRIESGLASILNATTPLFTVVVAGIWLADERMTPGKVVGVLVGFVGAVVVIGPGALTGLGDQALAQLAILGAGLAYAHGATFGRRFRAMGVDPMVTAAGQVSASTLLMIPLVLWFDRPWTLPMPPAEVWGAVAGLAVLATALAYIIYFRLLATAGATNILLVTFLVPVTAIGLGTLVLGESLAANHFLGMAVIGLGLACIDGRPWARLTAGSGAPRPRPSPGQGQGRGG